MSTKAITIESLNRKADFYQAALRELPFYDLTPELIALGITFLEVNGTDKVTTFQRKGGLAKPYKAGVENLVSSEEIGSVIERELKPETSYTALKDSILNYSDKKVISNAGEKVNNKTKEHPLEFLILRSKVRTVSEDILEALFHAKRDVNDRTPMGMFNGFNQVIDDAVSSGDLSTGKGNIVNTENIVTPANEEDTSALDIVVDFVRKANPFLRKYGWLWITQQTAWNCIDALGNKLRFKDAMEFDVFERYLQNLTGSPKLKIITHEALGTGSRLMMSVPGNLDFGMGTPDEHQFVHIRTPYEDPNIIQFWMQWLAGTRIVNLHPKEFQINNKLNSGVGLSGDYS